MDDKWQKVAQGLVNLSYAAPDYFMIVDADDLVSERLYDFVDERRPRHGLILRDGYIYRQGSFFVRLLKDRFNCGTNAVIATRSVPLPRGHTEGEVAQCIALRAGHTIIDEAMKAAGRPLDRMPFPAAVYVSHAEQHSTAIGSARRSLFRRFLGTAKRSVLRAPQVLQLRPAAKILREFL